MAQKYKGMKQAELNEALVDAIHNDEPLSTIKKIVSAGADPNCVVNAVQTPLRQAFREAKKSGIVKYLLDAGADPTLGAPPREMLGIYKALDGGSIQAVGYVIEALNKKGMPLTQDMLNWAMNRAAVPAVGVDRAFGKKAVAYFISIGADPSVLNVGDNSAVGVATIRNQHRDEALLQKSPALKGPS